MNELQVKKIILEVLRQLPPPYDSEFENEVIHYLNEVNQLLELKNELP